MSYYKKYSKGEVERLAKRITALTNPVQSILTRMEDGDGACLMLNTVENHLLPKLEKRLKRLADTVHISPFHKDSPSVN